MKEYKIQIKVQGIYMYINKIETKKNKIKICHCFDLLNYQEKHKKLLKTLLNHWKEYPIEIQQEDYYYLRCMGVIK